MKKLNTYFAIGLPIVLILAMGIYTIGNHHPKAKKVNHSQSYLPVSSNHDYHGQLKKQLSKVGFNGVALMIDDKKIVDSYQAGEANFKDDQDNDLNTTFEVDSLQKVMTAGLVMHQISEGNLKLSDHLSKYLPAIPGSKQITIRMLLDMRSGLSLKNLKYTGNKLSNHQLLKKVSQNVVFNSGKTDVWRYEPVNYVLLSEVIEKTSGKTYKQLFNEEYVKKLNLQNTEFAYDKQSTARAQGYNLKDFNSYVKRTLNMPNRATVLSELGTGQIFMSVSDYYRVVYYLMSNDEYGRSFKQAKDYFYGKNYHEGLYKNLNYNFANGYGYGFEDHAYFSNDGKRALIIFSNSQESNYKKLKKEAPVLANKFLTKTS